jgi:hypothetical protein
MLSIHLRLGLPSGLLPILCQIIFVGLCYRSVLGVQHETRDCRVYQGVIRSISPSGARYNLRAPTLHLVNYEINVNYEEWCVLRCYAMWLL